MSLTLLDWRRRVAALYAEVRSCPFPADAHALWQAGRDALLREHPESPVPSGQRFDGANVARYDPAYRFTVPVRPAADARWEVETGTDGLVQFRRVGVLEIDGVGTLDVWWLEGYGGGLFVPVRDALAGTTTYGGGRYVLDTMKGADLGGDADGLVVDFNFAYQPSCAYDPAWACPLAPEGNVVRAPLPVGELVVTYSLES